MTVIDNLSRPLTSGVVSAALTMRRWEDRLLGRNETVSVPVRTIWVLTANNPILSREIARRSIRIRLDSRRDRPWMREGFRHSDLRGWAHAHRADLVWAALVLVRAWLVAGRPAPRARPLGSFEDWTCLVGGILEHAGYQGFLANALDFYERADSEGSAWRAFTSQWWELHGDAAVGTKDLLTIAKEIDGFSLGRSTTENGQRNSLGKRLRKSVDRVIGDLRIEVAGTYQNSTQWRLRCLTPAEMPAAPPEAAEAPPSASPEEEEVDLRRAGRQP